MKFLLAAAAALAVGFPLAVQAQDATNSATSGPDELRAACQDDVSKLCPSSTDPRGVFRCLRQHQDQVSDACKTAIANARAQRQQHQGGASSPPPPN